jgi:hypothetical protein
MNDDNVFLSTFLLRLFAQCSGPFPRPSAVTALSADPCPHLKCSEVLTRVLDQLLVISDAFVEERFQQQQQQLLALQRQRRLSATSRLLMTMSQRDDSDSERGDSERQSSSLSSVSSTRTTSPVTKRSDDDDEEEEEESDASLEGNAFRRAQCRGRSGMRGEPPQQGGAHFVDDLIMQQIGEDHKEGTSLLWRKRRTLLQVVLQSILRHCQLQHDGGWTSVFLIGDLLRRLGTLAGDGGSTDEDSRRRRGGGRGSEEPHCRSSIVGRSRFELGIRCSS